MINQTISKIDLSLSFNYNDYLPVFIFTLGIVIYSILIFKFYRYLARRDVFKIDLQKYNTSEHPFFSKLYQTLLYLLKYFLIFPLVASFWFICLTLLLIVMSDHQLGTLLLISISFVSAVRITSYLSEDLAKDLAKMLPFALLGIFLVDMDFISYTRIVEGVLNIFNFFSVMKIYLIYLIIIELISRVIYDLIIWIKNEEAPPSDSDEEELEKE